MDETKEPPKRVAIYIRVSTEEQAERFGIDLQRAAIESLIESKKHTEQPYIFAGEEHVYIDDGISGTIALEERPRFARLIENIAFAPAGAKPFDVVAVYRIDRFARMLKILLSATDFFKQYELEFMSVTESIDTSTPFGRAMLSIIGVIAELERETIKDRMGGGWLMAVKDGVHMGTGAPFGFMKDDKKRLQVLSEEAEVIKMIFELFVIQKKSVYEISDYLTESKCLTPEASSIKNKKHKKQARANSPYKWHPENIRRILSNEVYAGFAYYGKKKNGKTVPKDQWLLYKVEPIIDEITFEKAQRIAQQSKHDNKPKRDTHDYLLTGLLRCDTCKKEHNVETLCWCTKDNKD
jgi:site-specific DNA recombinase